MTDDLDALLAEADRWTAACAIVGDSSGVLAGRLAAAVRALREDRNRFKHSYANECGWRVAAEAERDRLAAALREIVPPLVKYMRISYDDGPEEIALSAALEAARRALAGSTETEGTCSEP